MLKPIIVAGAVLVVCTAASAAFATHGDPAMQKKMVDHFFTKADTNKDGYISAEESAACQQKMFKEGDLNKDGQISKDEMAMQHEKQMKEMESVNKEPNVKDMKPGR